MWETTRLRDMFLWGRPLHRPVAKSDCILRLGPLELSNILENVPEKTGTLFLYYIWKRGGTKTFVVFAQGNGWSVR